ncbi:MAG: hypothetical protein IPL59_24700 [Candidatus Competibacteraceae bacterium]|nr:hypothetical protein [Candidatus Competibacteraceae bacterium]
MAVLMVSLRVSDRALPLAWLDKEGGQHRVRRPEDRAGQVLAWLPEEAEVVLLADRFYPHPICCGWLEAQGWGYRLRLKGNLLADPGHGAEVTTGELAQGVTERHLPGGWGCSHGASRRTWAFFTRPATPSRGSLPWTAPNRAAVLDYAARWAIEPMFSDFKGRGFELGRLATQVRRPPGAADPYHVAGDVLCVRIGQEDALNRLTPLEKNTTVERSRPLELQKLQRSPVSWTSPGDCAA